MLAGKKLLLADDSLAVQKVVALTFTDEGMQVTTVPDGRRALEELEQAAPDVILADVFMPGIDGYELCRYIKNSERWRAIPVMLLVGSFEPFEEAEARRAGADDIVTKPFQSIRELVSRVGVLLSGKPPVAEEVTHDYSTLGLAPSAKADTSIVEAEPEPKVFVEAAPMYEAEAIGSSGAACASDVEFQTADTMELRPLSSQFSETDAASLRHEEPSSPVPAPQVETLNVESDEIPASGAPGMINEPVSEAMQPAPAEVLNESILDLGDVDSFSRVAVEDDLVLDLDYEEPSQAEPPSPHAESFFEPVIEMQSTVEAAPSPVMATDELQFQGLEVAAVAEPVHEASAAQANPNFELSPEMIDAIAQRVVERLSDKAVRDIAWEVVPELAELLIRQKLSEQK